MIIYYYITYILENPKKKKKSFPIDKDYPKIEINPNLISIYCLTMMK